MQGRRTGVAEGGGEGEHGARQRLVAVEPGAVAGGGGGRCGRRGQTLLSSFFG